MASAEARDNPSQEEVVVIRDLQNNLPLTQTLGEGDLLYVLTPVVLPYEYPQPGILAEDPFEALGKALAKYHPWVRHIPYTVRDGISQYHTNHLKLAKAVVFAITGPPHIGHPSQVALSQVVRSIAPDCPHIVLVCCSLRDLGPSDGFFPTLIEIKDYSIGQLEIAARIIFTPQAPQRPKERVTKPLLPPEPSPIADAAPDSVPSPSVPPSPMDIVVTPTASVSAQMEPSPQTELLPRKESSPRTDSSPRKQWLVQEWDVLRDAQAMHELWCQCLPDRFRIDVTRLMPLLNRSGYSKHFVVRDPITQALLGFCATYTTYIDNRDAVLVGCIAVVLVQPSQRRRGIGTALHTQALRQLALHKVSRLQLGSAFPRLLYGLPFDLTSEEWFRRRGWRIDSSDTPGSGQEVCDWVLDFTDWRADGLSSGGLTFRHCEANELDPVLDFVVRESARKDNVGWYDQYCQLADPFDIHDILLVLEGSVIVATALSYVPQKNSRIAENLPWAGTISDEVGGVACICIADDNSTTSRSRDSVMIRLLNYCVETLKEQGMQRMFLDGIRGGSEGFQSIGFKKWARYKDVWRDA